MQVLGIDGGNIQGGYRLVANLEDLNFLLRTDMEKYFNTSSLLVFKCTNSRFKSR